MLARKEVTKIVALCKIGIKQRNVLIQLNPIALRKAKIVYNFGLSECNRVNVGLTNKYNLRDIIYSRHSVA